MPEGVCALYTPGDRLYDKEGDEGTYLRYDPSTGKAIIEWDCRPGVEVPVRYDALRKAVDDG